MKREYLPRDTLPAWVRLNAVSTHGVAFQRLQTEDGPDKGSGIVATADNSSAISGNAENPDILPDALIKVPADLVLTLQMAEDQAKSDRDLREVLEAVGEFGRTARGAILIFLLMQITHSSPDFDFADQHHRIGLSCPWTEYVKYMPASIPLPTFYTEEELELLRGTSLRLAVDTKLASLQKEFDHLRQSTENIPWCQKYWWDEETGKLVIDDWKYVDAVYRSRAGVVDLPGRSGQALVPCVDMANHTPEAVAKAKYDEDDEGNALLRLRSGQMVRAGDEVTISYGDEKSATEMVFSYGFLDSGREDAKQLLLNLDIPDDDPLKMAKKMLCDEAPGFRLYTKPDTDSIGWVSPFVWWACVNEEDGLNFTVMQTNDGGKELKASWKEEDLTSSSNLKEVLERDPLWDIFQLRAVVLIMERLEDQYLVLRQTGQVVSEISQNEDMRAIFRPDVFSTIVKLRELETQLMEKGIEELAKQRENLINSDTVLAYLNQQAGNDIEEDFS